MLGLAVLVTLMGAGSSLLSHAPNSNTPAQIADGQETHGIKEIYGTKETHGFKPTHNA